MPIRLPCLTQAAPPQTCYRDNPEITDGDGEKEQVDGPGVVGEYPHLHPGQSYQYTSGSVLKTPVGTMGGSYQMRADDGTKFEATIPIFTLNAVALH